MSIQSELCALKQKHKLLTTKTIHRWAERHPDSAIYAALEWDEEAAAYQYRLSQISELVRIHCVDTQGIRTLVSLSVDRVVGGGYRSMQEVLDDRKLSEILLHDALEELRRFEERYKLLQDLVRGIKKLRKKAETAENDDDGDDDKPKKGGRKRRGESEDRPTA